MYGGMRAGRKPCRRAVVLDFLAVVSGKFVQSSFPFHVLRRMERCVVDYTTPDTGVMMAWWTVQDAIPTLLMEGETPERQVVRWASRGMMVVILLFQLCLINRAWARRALAGKA